MVQKRPGHAAVQKTLDMYRRAASEPHLAVAETFDGLLDHEHQNVVVGRDW